MANVDRLLFDQAESLATKVNAAGLRYGLVVIIGWIGLLKFTDYEANGIQPLVANSPFMGWLYNIFSVTAFSALLGGFEVVVAILLAVAPWLPRVSALGSLLAIGMFLGTLSFLFTTPGVGEVSAGGFPLLSMTGQFLIKDLALLAISVWTLADSLGASARRTDRPPAAELANVASDDDARS